MAEDEGGIDPGIIDTSALDDANGAGTQVQVGVIAQYVKDLSFENPNAPAVYQWQGQPQTDVQFNIGAANVGQDLHEVTLKIDVAAKSEQGTAFQLELLYAGLFVAIDLAYNVFERGVLARASATWCRSGRGGGRGAGRSSCWRSSRAPCSSGR